MQLCFVFSLGLGQAKLSSNNISLIGFCDRLLSTFLKIQVVNEIEAVKNQIISAFKKTRHTSQKRIEFA
ncbi:hypothetical protein JYB64_18115 [Algoriphagus aestuarii]|nr:hypothetical protein [Algoriphagus aestuarii]